MSNWRSRLTIASFPFPVSLSIWGVVLMTLLTLALALYTTAAGTVPSRGFGGG